MKDAELSSTIPAPKAEAVAIDIHRLSIQGKTEDRAGYVLRFELKEPPGTWTQAVFIAEESIEGILQWVETFLRTEGHLSRQSASGGLVQ